ncbi:MAG: MFS transporter [Rhodospirillales bacterium]|nr:MFS transporter [Rhodospirillales bacterium]
MQSRDQGPAFLVALGHSATHWIIGTFYVLLPFIQKDLGLNYAETGGLITLFHASSFVANVGSGLAVDVTGRRVLLQFLALVIGALALAATNLFANLFWLYGVIVIVGITNNLWHPAAISYLSNRFPRNRGYALSVHALGASFGDAVAPLAAGVLLLWMGWSSVASFHALPVLGIAAAILIILGPGEKTADTDIQPKISRLDYWTGIKKMVRNKAVLGVAGMAGLRSMTQNGLLVFLPLYLANFLHAGPFLLGLGMMAMQVSGLIAAPIAGVFSDRLGRRIIVLLGMGGTTIVTFAMPMIDHIYLFIATAGLLGFVLFAVRPVIHSWMMDLTPKQLGGSATSLLFGVQAGLSTSVPIIGGLIADQWGLPVVFYILAGFGLAATVMTFLLPDSLSDMREAA